MVPARPRFSGKPGWVRSSAWIWLFSSTDSTTACRWRVYVETDDVAQLKHEVWIVRELEAAQAVRLKAVRLPDALHRRQADADGLGHGRGRPVRRLVRRLGRGQRHHPVDHARQTCF